VKREQERQLLRARPAPDGREPLRRPTYNAEGCEWARSQKLDITYFPESAEMTEKRQSEQSGTTSKRGGKGRGMGRHRCLRTRALAEYALRGVCRGEAKNSRRSEDNGSLDHPRKALTRPDGPGHNMW